MGDGAGKAIGGVMNVNIASTLLIGAIILIWILAL
jgi:hypothetical protein